jgi:cytochrome c-type biogenesis protein
LTGKKWQVFWTSLAFVFGFSVAFTLLGASATSIGKFLFTNKSILTKASGLLVVVFGLHMIGIFRIPLLYQEKRFQVARKPPGALGAFLIGLAFAFGWTPCIGPFLGAALTLAAQKQTVLSGMLLLFTFSLGLGIPLLLTSIAFNAFLSAFQRIKRYFHLIEIVGGGLLVAIGILLITGGFTRLASRASGLPEISLGPSGENLTFVSAFIAGILAFVSPCVLPLIPGYISYVSGVSLQELQQGSGSGNNA